MHASALGDAVDVPVAEVRAQRGLESRGAGSAGENAVATIASSASHPKKHGPDSRATSSADDFAPVWTKSLRSSTGRATRRAETFEPFGRSAIALEQLGELRDVETLGIGGG
jgi:hypothetical protein